MRIIDTLRAKSAEEILVRLPDQSIAITTRMLIEKSEEWARWIHTKGIDEVTIRMGNCPEFLYVLIGALRNGTKVRILSILHDEPEDDSIILYDGKNKKIRCSRGIDVHSIDCSNTSAESFEEYDWDMEEVVVALETSGTSGDRKFIQKNMKSFFTEQVSNWRKLANKVHLSAFNVSPWYHNTGFSLISLLFADFTYEHITINAFNPLQVKKYLKETKPTVWVGTGSMLYRSCVADSTQATVPHIIISTGEAIDYEHANLLAHTKGFWVLVNSYGTTETQGISSCLCVSRKSPIWMRIVTKLTNIFTDFHFYYAEKLEEYFVGDILKSVWVEIRNADANGIGEVWAKTPSSMLGTENSYIRTGDLGFKNGRQLYITGRVSSVINRSGEKILPSDIESVVKQIETVNDAVVFGIPSQTHGEGICLCVEGHVEENQVREALPKYLWPQEIHCFDEFPLNASGKKDPRMFVNGKAKRKRSNAKD